MTHSVRPPGTPNTQRSCSSRGVAYNRWVRRSATRPHLHDRLGLTLAGGGHQASNFGQGEAVYIRTDACTHSAILFRRFTLLQKFRSRQGLRAGCPSGNRCRPWQMRIMMPRRRQVPPRHRTQPAMVTPRRHRSWAGPARQACHHRRAVLHLRRRGGKLRHPCTGRLAALPPNKQPPQEANWERLSMHRCNFVQARCDLLCRTNRS